VAASFSLGHFEHDSASKNPKRLRLGRKLIYMRQAKIATRLDMRKYGEVPENGKP